MRSLLLTIAMAVSFLSSRSMTVWVGAQLCPTFDRLSAEPSTQKSSSSEIAIPLGMIFARKINQELKYKRYAHILLYNEDSTFCFLLDQDRLKLDGVGW